MLEQAKKRILSAEEAGWIDRKNEEIQNINSTIIDLAGVLDGLADLAEVEGLDPRIRKNLCLYGIQALAVAIKNLGLNLADKQGYIDNVLTGVVAAEMHARRKAVDAMYQSAPSPPLVSI